MNHILPLLRQLDEVYPRKQPCHYQQYWQVIEQQLRQIFPGFTLAYAEIALAGHEREPLGSMRYVVVPSPA